MRGTPVESNMQTQLVTEAHLNLSPVVSSARDTPIPTLTGATLQAPRLV